MKKQVLTFINILFFLISFQIVSAQFQIDLPTITPTSPEAANFGRYGDVPLNAATGQMSYSIPIYNINVDGNSWPISLNYNYGGLLLEGKPSLVGLGWNLSGYASITKETRGLPDGHPDGYYGANGTKSKINNVLADYFDDQSFNQTTFEDLSKFRNNLLDSEADKYTVNIGNIHFSFKLIEHPTDNGKALPYYLSRHNYKVSDISKNPLHNFEALSFVVTDDKGIKYYFNRNIPTNIDHRELVVQEEAGTAVYFDDSTTAWMLSQIQYLNGETIDFEYELDNYFSYDFSAGGNELDLDTSTEIAIIPHVPQWSNDYYDQITKTEIQRQILKKIKFPSGSIDLITTPIGTSSRKLLNSVTLNDINNIPVTTYNFSYTGNRDALIEITKNSEKYYSFEYYGINTPGNIPSFFESYTEKPYDQDSWKYYNNAGNNRAIHMPYDGALYHVSNDPNFIATREGALMRIKYPTGGYTEVNYEQNQVKKPYAEGLGSSNEAFNRELYVSLEPKLDNTERYVSMTHTFDYPVRAQLFHKIVGNIALGNSIYLSIEKLSGPIDSYGDCYGSSLSTIPYYPMVIEDARNKMINDPVNCVYYPNPILSPILLVNLDPDNGCPWYPSNGDDFSEAMGCTSGTTINQNDSSRGDFWIAPGTYKFTIDVRNFTYESLFAEIKLRYFDPAVANGGILPEFIDVNVGGIRVSKLIDYDENGNYKNVKHYSYLGEDEYSSGRLNQIPLTTVKNVWNHHNSALTPSNWTQQLIEYRLGSYTALNKSHGTPVYYDRIKSFNSETLNPSEQPNGYTVQTFELPNEDLAFDFPSIPKGEDLTKTRPSITTIFDDNSTIVSTSSKSYSIFRHLLQNQTDYDFNNEHPWSFKYYKKLEVYVDWDTYQYDQLYPDIGTPQDIGLKLLHDIKPYKEVNEKHLISQESSMNQGVNQNRTITYDSRLQVQSVTTNANYINNDDEIKIEYDYAYELAGNPYQDMVDIKNQISSIIEQRMTTNGELSTQKTDFTLVKNGYKPSVIYSSKGTNTLEPRVQYNYEPSKGRLKEVIQLGTTGTPTTSNSKYTSYLWGYDWQFPVAKVDNASYSTIQDSNVDLAIVNNSATSDVAMRTELNKIRQSIPNAMVSTFTYKPLVGVSSTTDPNGYTTYYDYDNLNRVQYIKNNKSEVIEENKYHFRLDEIQAYTTSSASSVSSGQNITFTTNASGGSENFTYKWTVFNGNVNQIYNTNTNALTITTTSDYSPSFTVTCEVTDSQTNEVVTTTTQVDVTASYSALYLGKILYSGTRSVGNSISYTVNPSGGSGNYQYTWSKTNSQNTITYFNNTSSLSAAISLSDCSFFTIRCVVKDLTTNETVIKSVKISVLSGCSNPF